MPMFGIVALVAWIFIVFWGIWYVNVQLERLHRSTFNRSRHIIFAQLRSSSGVFWLIGIVFALYFPV